MSWHEAAAYCNALSAAEGRALCYTCSGSRVTVNCGASPAYATPYACPGYRLPTEAEWEYAARAGTTTATYNGNLDSSHETCENPNPVLEPIAWFCGNADDTTHAVATKRANVWGLYDMLGNVQEWCNDGTVFDLGAGAVTNPWYPAEGSDRVTRGGDYLNFANRARAAMRDQEQADSGSCEVGFRPGRSIGP
jgi:formylglycine-generating enzyme required for sulfatase activity